MIQFTSLMVGFGLGAIIIIGFAALDNHFYKRRQRKRYDEEVRRAFHRDAQGRWKKGT